jgi:FeS assembly SUF system protein
MTDVAQTIEPGSREEIEKLVLGVLRSCYDPEIPVNIYELGLVYGIDVTAERAVNITMTLTSPACPVAGSLPPEVEEKMRMIPGVSAAHVEVVWDPPWTPERMTEEARLELGFF